MNLLITGAWQGFEDCRSKIEQAGHSIRFLQWEKDPLPCDPEWVEGIIGNGIFLHHDISQFTNLRCIQLTSAGYDRVPMDYVKAHEIAIYNARGVYSIPMAEFALCGVLQLYKRSRAFADSQARCAWEKQRGLRELDGKTVCIIGCGSVGTECAKRFKAFGCLVVGIDIFPRSDPNYDTMQLPEQLDETLRCSDIVVATVPITEETGHLLNSERLNSLKTGAVVVNIARGGILDYAAFAEIAPKKQLGAVLDVFEEEPLPPGSPVWKLENAVITPHNSFEGEGNRGRLNEIIMRNLGEQSL